MVFFYYGGLVDTMTVKERTLFTWIYWIFSIEFFSRDGQWVALDKWFIDVRAESRIKGLQIYKCTSSWLRNKGCPLNVIDGTTAERNVFEMHCGGIDGHRPSTDTHMLQFSKESMDFNPIIQVLSQWLQILTELGTYQYSRPSWFGDHALWRFDLNGMNIWYIE